MQKHAVFFFVFLFLVLKYAFKEVLGINEQVILPIAKHFIDPTWIPSDWYLGLNSETNYRLFFNLLAGGMSLIMPLEVVSVIGRLISFVFFSFFMQTFANLFNLRTIILIPVLFLFSNNQGLVAGEWIIRGFETKPFAYICCFLALISLIKREYGKMMILAGLSISFHMLIGVFGAITLGLTGLLNFKEYKNDFMPILKKSWIAFLTGSFGLVVIVNYLMTESVADSQLASEIYVLFRTPHHTYPGSWVGYKYGILLVTGISLFVIIFLTAKERALKLWASYGLTGSIFFIIGLSFYWGDNIYMLKFYWFRFSDSVIPFFFLMILAILIDQIFLQKKYPLNIPLKWKVGFHIPEPVAITIRRVFFLATAGLFVFLGKDFAIQIDGIRKSSDKSYIEHRDLEVNKAMIWINGNTDKNSQFLVNPHLRNFYLIAERGMFVSLKHFVQKNDHIIEWYHRLQHCNNDQPFEKTSVFKIKKDLDNNFNHIPVDKLRVLAVEYDLEYYLCKSNRILDLPVVFENAGYKLYRIAE